MPLMPSTSRPQKPIDVAHRVHRNELAPGVDVRRIAGDEPDDQQRDDERSTQRAELCVRAASATAPAPTATSTNRNFSSTSPSSAGHPALRALLAHAAQRLDEEERRRHLGPDARRVEKHRRREREEREDARAIASSAMPSSSIQRTVERTSSTPNSAIVAMRAVQAAEERSPGTISSARNGSCREYCSPFVPTGSPNCGTRSVRPPSRSDARRGTDWRDRDRNRARSTR